MTPINESKQPDRISEKPDSSLLDTDLGMPDTTIRVLADSASQEVSRSLLESEKSYKVAIGQISTQPGQISENTDKIIRTIEHAKDRGAKLIVLPELAIPGYCSMDLLFNRSYISENLRALQKIKEATAGISAIIGFVDHDPSSSRSGGRPLLYNSAAIIHDGMIVGVQDKTLLPTYDIFFEDRYFAPPRSRRVHELSGALVGTEICEDLWKDGYSEDVSRELVNQGANLLVNISASPFHLGKLATRAELIKTTAMSSGVPFVYANLVGAFDGYEGEVVFDGRSMIMSSKGELLALGNSFQEELVCVDILHPQVMAFPNIREVEELHDALVLGIKDYFHRIGGAKGANFKYAIIGLSGGIDSALVAALAVEALGRDKVLGITMPSKYSSSETKGDAYKLAENLGIKIKTVPIEEQCQASINQFRSDHEIADLPEDVAEENIQARMRMLNLMYYGNKMHGLVLNTGNKTELALDNCTIYGDMVGGFSVLGDVDKDRIYALSRYINERHGKELIPLSTIERPPSAELRPNQTDDAVMGAMPQVIAPMVRAMVEEGLSVQETIARFGDQFSRELIERSFRRLDRSEWKRRQGSPAIRVTPKAFGNGRRMPMNHGYYK